MKLLAKTSLYYLILIIPILIISGFICYYFITIEVKYSNDELLFNRKNVVEKYLITNDEVALNLITKSGEAQIKNVTKSLCKHTNNQMFADTLILDKKENELANNRMITSFVKVNNSYYQIKIWRSTLEFDELFEGIFYFLFFIFFFLFLISMLINFWVSKTLWKPFYYTVSSLNSFRASDNTIPHFYRTSIAEFSDLNSSLSAMMGKMISDYNSQKKFTENASHEIQTPLAVIKSKIDLLIQSQNLEENEMKLIIAIDDACSKLARLNKSLLLLTKIENRQYNEIEKVSFGATIDNSLLFFQEHIEANRLEVIKNSEADFCVRMNPDLCLILINNLIQNAIRYNTKEGTIEIFMNQDKCTIINTGNNEPINPNLFERFQKNSTSNQSLGLGLSIIKEILEVSCLSLNYRYTFNKHRFIISLNNDNKIM